jgi:hypothetical protein
MPVTGLKREEKIGRLRSMLPLISLSRLLRYLTLVCRTASFYARWRPSSQHSLYRAGVDPRKSRKSIPAFRVWAFYSTPLRVYWCRGYWQNPDMSTLRTRYPRQVRYGIPLSFVRIPDDACYSYWGIFWIDASSNEGISESIGRIIVALGVEQDVEAIRQKLAATEQLWLLVFDNVEDPNIPLSEYFPPGVRGDIIITGVDHELQQYSTVGHEKLGAMDRDKAKALLLSTYGQSSINDEDMADEVGDIVDFLGGLPLAIANIAAYMRSKRLSP